MENYANALTEVYTILNYLQKDDYSKIDPELIQAIEENRNTNYNYEMNAEVDLTKQPMMEETRAILFNLFRDYLCTPKQKEKILKIEQVEREKIEQKKQEMYNIDFFANVRNNKKEVESQTKEKTVELVKYKKNIFNRIFDKIKSFFNII